MSDEIQPGNDLSDPTGEFGVSLPRSREVDGGSGHAEVSQRQDIGAIPEGSQASRSLHSAGDQGGHGATVETVFSNVPKDRSQWSREHYVEALRQLRRKAKSLRERANAKDAEADALRKEFAATSTEKLPLFNQ
jgi:hypothetical protein